MKNLKRVLSLGLASVMLLGMMVMGASATGKDFTDADKIVNGEAVQVLVALGIVNGKEDGSYFDPEGTVTRGEMAKMIAVAMNGGSEANTGVKGTPTFTDIGGHWAEGWIEYCVDMGIIGGRGDGTFDPNGLVTGTEALKMVLTAMGYDATAYKLEGAGWAAQTLENARKTQPVNLTENLDNITMTAPATRDTAAQMIWNGLQSYVVDITPDKNTNTGETTWQYKPLTSTTLLKQRYKADVETAVFTGNNDYSEGGAPADDEISVNHITYTTNSTTGVVSSNNNYWTFPAEMDIDYIGEEVKVVWKDGAKSLKTGAPDRQDTIYGVFVTGATRVERTTLNNVKDNKNSKQQINLNGTVCDVDDKVEVIYNYGAKAKKTFTKGNTTSVWTGSKSETLGDVTGVDEGGRNSGNNSALTATLKQKRGDAVKAVFNDNGKVTKIYVTETEIASVSSINSTNVTINNGVGTVKLSGNDVEEGLVKGDVVTVTKLYNATNNDAFITVKKAEKVSGEVEAYGLDGGATTSITLSGKKYNVYMEGKGVDPDVQTYAAGKGMLDVLETDKDTATMDTTDTKNTFIGKDFDLYLVNGYVGAAVKTSADASNYSVITEVKDSGTAGATFSSVQLQVMGSDGTKEIITVSKDSDDLNTRKPKAGPSAVNDITFDDYSVGDIITYSFDKDDYAEVTVEAKVGAAAAGTKYSDNTKILTKDGVGTVTTSDCVFYAQTEAGVTVTLPTASSIVTSIPNAEWDAWNIRDLDDIDLTAGRALTVAYNEKGDRVVAVFMDLRVIPDGAADDTVYGIVSAYNGRVADYYNYTIQSNGETYTVNSKNSKLTRGSLVRFRPTADDTYSTNAIKEYKASCADNITATWQLTIDVKNIGWVDEFSTRDNTLTYYYGNAGSKGDKVGSDGDNYTDVSKLTSNTYALAKDAVIVYVDMNNRNSTGESSVDHWSEYTGRANVAFVTKEVDDEDVISVMFVETSTRTDIDGRNMHGDEH